jgi:hypothetical protein
MIRTLYIIGKSFIMIKVYLHLLGLELTYTYSLFQLDSVSTEIGLADDLLCGCYDVLAPHQVLAPQLPQVWRLQW